MPGPAVATVQQIAERPVMAPNVVTEQYVSDTDLQVERRFSESLNISIARNGGQFSESRFVAVHLQKQVELCGGDDFATLKRQVMESYESDYLAGLISITGQ